MDHEPPKGLVSIGGTPARARPLFRDPVCEMLVDPGSAAGSHAHNGVTYYFCNVRCLERFRAEPERFLSPAPAQTAAAPGA
jgi:Cu+-exporting ATPase